MKMIEKKEALDAIRLDSVQIDGLFNTFNYRFEYDNEEHTSIVIAPNGCGKTTIFKFISFLMLPTKELLQPILTVPYKKIVCSLSNGTRVVVEKIVKKVVRKRKLTIEFDENDSDFEESKETKAYDISFWEEDQNGVKLKPPFKFCDKLKSYERRDVDSFAYLDNPFNDSKGISEEHIARLSKMSQKEWIDYLGEEKTAGSYWFRLQTELRTYRELEYPTVCFIPANRTQVFFDASSYRYTTFLRDVARKLTDTDPLSLIQRDINSQVRREIASYNRLMDEAKNALPQQFLEDRNDGGYSSEEKFLKEWSEYIGEIKKYSEIGLISSDQLDLGVEYVKKAYEDKGKRIFLEIYLAQYQKTLAPLRKIYPKLELFTDILNQRNKLTGKVIKIDNRIGRVQFKVECRGEEIPLNALSSGEKNDFIMFYRLIFETKQGMLILIDEPENSLHITWQDEYIDHLLRLCKISDCQAIVATHSPNIIGGHFDLYAKREVVYDEE